MEKRTEIGEIGEFGLINRIAAAFTEKQDWIENIFEALTVIVALALVRALLKSLRDYLKTLKSFKDKPIDSYIQVIMLLLWLFGIVSFILILFDVSKTTLLTTVENVDK